MVGLEVRGAAAAAVAGTMTQHWRGWCRRCSCRPGATAAQQAPVVAASSLAAAQGCPRV